MKYLTSLLLYLARPYRKGHLHHADGALYMERYSLFETRWLSARIHYIATPDLDRHLHDHPWDFVSVILQGGYIEQRPVSRHMPRWLRDGSEHCTSARRNAGSVAYRRATDRHLISSVDLIPGTWTLFIYGIGVQWWGFYTRAGKVHWCDYSATKGLSNDAAEMDNYRRDNHGRK